MQAVEKVREVAQDMLSLDEIHLCQEVGKLVKEIPDEKIRFPQIHKLWEAHKATYPKGRNWADTNRANIIAAHWVWLRTLQAEHCTAEELFALINNYIKEADVSPLIYFRLSGLWIFKGYIYKVNGKYSDAQAQLLIQEAYDQEKKLWEKLNRKYSRSEELSQEKRARIPENVRIEVWRRDGGKCARCGSREKLEYDHIIPLSRGGSNTSRNIELLCERCNRQKGANIE
jgi:hypothetical protein